MKPNASTTTQPRGTRTYHHKTRTGCANCKQRKIKCDETKPVCQRCQNSRLVCQGYNPPKTWLFQLPNKGPSKSELEHQLLTFSHGEGIQYMTLYAKSTQDFFQFYAPQMTHLHPSAKHALLALSAQYQAILQHITPSGDPETARKFRTDALLHYNRGMHELSRTDNRQVPLEVLLSCSLLFAAFELWPQKNMAPHVHILHALRICQDVPPETIHSKTLQGYLIRTILFLAENVVSYHDDYSEASMKISDVYLDVPWTLPDIFSSPIEANELVDKLVKRAARLDVKSAGDAHNRRPQLWEVHGRLSQVIERSTRQCKPDTHLYHDFRSLQVHLRTSAVLLKTNMTSDEMVFDKCLEDFEFILSESEERLSYEIALGSDRGPGSVRSTLGLIPPLFLVATKCRDSALRNRALELLQGARRRERSWNSCVAAIVAQTVVDVEEPTFAPFSLDYSWPEPDERVCLSHVAFDREQGFITIQYESKPWDASNFPTTVVRPWRPIVDDNYEIVSLSHKSLRAYGYTGTILISPRITCQCVEGL